MGFQWDPDKADSNFRKHGIAFLRAAQIFQDPVVLLEDRRRNYGERRLRAIGETDGDILRVVFTLRDGDIRIISAWRAGKHDRTRYEKDPRKELFTEASSKKD